MDLPRFSIGSLLAASLVVVAFGWLPFLVSTLGLTAMVHFGLGWLYEVASPQPDTFDPWSSAGFVALSVAGNALLSSFVTGLALTIIETEAADWRRALARMPAVIPQIAPLSLIFALLSLLGSTGRLPPLGLGAATLFLATFTWVYVPVAVREGGNPLRLLRRNLELTQGRRWKIFGLIVLLIVLTIVGQILVEQTTGRIFTASAGSAWIAPFLSVAFINLMEGLGYVAATVGYSILSIDRGDSMQSDIAKVFD